ncbi:hypothetical protein BASA81_001522 [Batrachochytrium salamandrivorans]|nr:hypothetical protein BASA81_001522 [Batrachochytrium salamandrivorans]
MDGSNSLRASNFYNEMMDYALGLYCAFNPQYAHQVGMLVFGAKIQPLITLDRYSRAEWHTKVLGIRSEMTACCTCCTPTADAFDLARAHFDQFAIPGNIRIAMTVTDGVPSNNAVGTDGNPAWLFTSAAKGFNPATYNYQVVPNRATLLKTSGARLMLLGVPSGDGSKPDILYFNGLLPLGSQQCLNRDQTQFCATYNAPPFPITSTPVTENTFSAVDFNLTKLLALTVGAVCILPTSSPTLQPFSKSPTLAPSKSPTRRPTSLAPTKQPTLLPTASPTYIYLDQVDIHILMDHSNSMWWRDKYCRSVVPPGDNMPASLKASACWNLWINFVRNVAIELTGIMAGINRDRALGWYDDFSTNKDGTTPPPKKGLRISLVGFACANNQRTPRTFPFTYQFNNNQPMLTNLTQLDEMLAQMRFLVPSGGTCPGLGIEEVVRYVEDNAEADFPLQAVILLSDGVFYDRPSPAKATTGLAAYKAMRFSVGVAINDIKVDSVRKAQIQDMTAFAGDAARFYDLNTQGWAVLDDVAKKVAQDLPKYVASGANPLPRYSWCGWRRLFACQGNGEPWRANKCKWRGKKTKSAQYQCFKPASG